MSHIKIGVVEDEMLIAQNICSTLRQLGYQVCEPVDSYSDAIKMVQAEQPDLLLLDIHLAGEKDGIDLAHHLRQHYAIPFIYLTANSDALTVERAKATRPPAYIVKPFNKADLYTSIEIAFSNFSRNEPDNHQPGLQKYGEALFVKDGYTFQKITLNDILYCYSEHVYIKIITPQREHLVRSSLQEYMQSLDPAIFARVHRRYVVNIKHIDQIQTQLLIVNGNEIPLAREYREALLQKLHIH